MDVAGFRLAAWTLLLALVLPCLRAADPPEFAARARLQIEALHAEKAGRTPLQKKLDSQLVYALKLSRGQAVPGAPSLKAHFRSPRPGQILVDITAQVGDDLLGQIRARGGQVISQFPQFNAIRALLPLDAIEVLAGRPDVTNIRPADEATTNTGAVTSEGDITHRALDTRQDFGVNGGGIKIGVLSDSADFLNASQQRGELPSVTILPGQSGQGFGEGVAMMEIIHDLAPGAELFFATAFSGEAGFAQNIRDLYAAGCRIIVDDVTYFRESPFQDGLIAQAVNDVSAGGALFFSSAGNSGHQSALSSGTWEGDYVDGGAATAGRGGRWHSFGPGIFNTLLPGPGFRRVDLFWADPLGASTNDYDVYLLNEVGQVVAASTNPQQGQHDPYENILGADLGQRIAIVKYSGEARFLHLSSGRGVLAWSTAGATRGHNASGASNAFCVAATWVRSPAVPFRGGTINPVEVFSSDGPRRMFFAPDGSPLTPGNFTATGGLLLSKPDLTAADGVATSVPNFEHFFGTSAAAPHAASIAALVWSFNPSLSPAEVRRTITESVLDVGLIGPDGDSGAGIAMAWESVMNAPPPPPRLQLISHTLQDGNGSGVLDANECGEIFLSLKNFISPQGNTAEGVSVMLLSETPGLVTDPTPQPWPDIPPGEARTTDVPFRVSTQPEYVCGTPAHLRVVITTSNAPTASFILELASTAPGIGQPVSIVSTDVPGIIPDLATLESTTAVSGVALPLAKVTVSLFLTHSYASDLEITLVAPDGTAVELASANGAGGDNYGASCLAPTIFDDAASLSITQGIVPFTGVFRPEQSLATFNDHFPNGNWRLRVKDKSEFDSGTLQCWSLKLWPIVCLEGSGRCLIPPRVVHQPQSVIATNGTAAMFSTVIEGDEPLHYQWYSPGTNLIAGATNSTLMISNATLEMAGRYFVVASNFLGTARSDDAQLLVVVPPQILQQPVSQLVTNGRPASLIVAVAGTDPLHIQWFFERTNVLAQATNVLLRLDPVMPSHAGSYFAVVSNSFGAVTSEVALLTVVLPPVIVAQPQSQSIVEGAQASFSVSATGDEPLGYQWYFNENEPIPGATARVLVLNNVQSSQDGGYSVVVTNPYGRAASTEALLTVAASNAPPTVSLSQPISGATFGVNTNAILLQATASDPDGSITKVEFFADGRRLGEVNVAPYRFAWLDPIVGPTALQAVATDNRALSATSSVVRITVLATTNQARLIPTHATWKYWDRGSLPATEWKAASYSDLDWSSGAGEFGYGEDDETTLISFGSDSNNRFITTYFRHSFVLTDPGSWTNLIVRLLRDDGAVVYLNGAEVFRSNMPNGPIGFGTLASSQTSGAAERTYFQTNIAPSHLVAGTNVVSVEVHLESGRSRDLSFDLELTGRRSFAPRIVVPPLSTTTLAGDATIFAVEAIGATPLRYQWYFNQTQALANATNSTLSLTNLIPSASGSYHVVVSNAFGGVRSADAILTVINPDDVPPSVHLDTPTNAAHFPSGATIALHATATDIDGQIVTVEFYADGLLLHRDFDQPFKFNWANASNGVRALWALAIDSGAQRATSTVANIVIGPPGSSAQTLVPTGSIWKYLDTGVNQATAWRHADFDDRSWPQGPAELGYGDSVEGYPEATVVSPGPDSKFASPTHYFRHAFFAEALQTIEQLHLRLQRDDGAIVYLNGVEVFRSNMPEGAITFDTLAVSVAAAIDERTFFVQEIDPALLVAGRNVLAVEVHQVNRTRNDLSFDLELRAQRINPPTILVQPQSLTASNGLTARFEVVASGGEPLIYQWHRDGIPLSGKTNAVLQFSNVTPDDAGDYDVVISNSVGTAQSDSATLVVIVPPPNILPSVTLDGPSDGAVFSVNQIIPLTAQASDPDGQVIRVEFFADAIKLGESTTVPYAFDWIGAPLGSYNLRALAIDDGGATNSSPAIRVVVAPALPPAGFEEILVARGALWKYLDSGIDQGTSWKDREFDDAAWSSGLGELGYGDAVEGRPEATQLSYGPDPTNKFPTYYFRKTLLLTNAVDITDLRLRLLCDDGAAIYLNGREVWRDNLPQGELRFLDLALRPIDKEDEDVLLAVNLLPTHLREGTNVLAVEVHQASSDSSDVSFDLELIATRPSAPTIVVPPENQTVVLNQTAQFFVLAAGGEPLTYQWYRNGLVPLPGGTNNTLTISNAQIADEGSYSVTVSNRVGLTQSNPVLLRILEPPQILVPPRSADIPLGQRVEFSVQAAGVLPLSYQWFFNLSNRLGGATGPSLVLPAVTEAQNGLYHVAVSNIAGHAESEAAILRVLAASQIISVGLAGNVVNLSFTTSPNLRYTVEYSPTLTQSPWVELAGAVKRFGTGGLLSAQDSGPMVAQRFYRVRVE